MSAEDIRFNLREGLKLAEEAKQAADRASHKAEFSIRALRLALEWLTGDPPADNSAP